MSCTNCSADETPVKQLTVTTLAFDFWRDLTGTQPDGVNDHTEAITHNGPVAIGTITPTAGKALTVVGDVDIQGQLDPNSIVFSDVPVGVTTAFDSVANGYYKVGVNGTQRPLVLMPATDATDAAQVRRADGVTVVLDVDTLNRRTGINVTPQAALDVNGAVIHRALDIADQPLTTALTAPLSVDMASVLSFAQATAGITVTIPSPTIVTPGRLLICENVGIASLTLQTGTVTTALAAGKMTPFVWSGTAWVGIAAGGAGANNDFFRSGTGSTLPDGTNDFTEAIAHNGDLGLGIADPSTVRARLDVSGAQVLRPVTVANKTVAGVIGTAAATVDVASVLLLAQTTANMALTLPNPTQTQGGRILAAVNTGTAQVKLNGQYIDPGVGLSFVWDGTAWRAIGNQADFATVAASRTLTLADNYKTLLASTAVTLTVPPNLAQYFICRIRQSATAGVITIAAGAGVTLVAPYGAATLGLAGDSKIVEVIGSVAYVS